MNINNLTLSESLCHPPYSSLHLRLVFENAFSLLKGGNLIPPSGKRLFRSESDLVLTSLLEEGLREVEIKINNLCALTDTIPLSPLSRGET